MKVIDRLEEVFISLSILIATLLVLVNVILRLMGSGITWSEELIRYLLIWVTFVGMSVCARQREHVSIEFIPQMLKAQTHKILMIFIQFTSLIFSIILTLYSFQLLRFNIETGQVTPGLGLPFYLIYLVIPLSGMLLIVRYSQELIKLFVQKPLEHDIKASDEYEGVKSS